VVTGSGKAIKTTPACLRRLMLVLLFIVIKTTLPFNWQSEMLQVFSGIIDFYYL
jgi:hypothetical protein